MENNRTLKPKFALRQKITMILFGIFLFFVILEASLRLGGFILLSMQEHRNSESIKQKGAYRILCLGESTTQGQYPVFLEEILNRSNIGVRFNAVDKGKANTNTPIILSKVEFYLDKYHPDLVVAMMGINDWGEHIPFERTTTSKGMLLIRSFRTYKLARLLWLHILTKAKEKGVYISDEGRWFFRNFPRIELKEDRVESIPKEDAFKQIVGLNSKNDNVYLQSGWFYLDQGNFSLAEDAFKKGIDLNPKDDDTYVGLGKIYQDQLKFLQAEEAFKKAVELNPKNDSAYAGLGWVYRNQGKLPQAEDLYKKAVELNPKNDNAYIELGQLYREQGKFSEAEDLYKKALEFNPKNDNAYIELGWVYRDQGKFSQAEESFKKALELNPKNDGAYGAISVLYLDTGRPELVEEYVQKADSWRLESYNPVTVNSYRKLKKILDKSGIRLICVQYPMRSVEPLKKIFEQDEGVIFVDNESVFKEALKKTSYKDYFKDMFGGDFGHCTDKGNKLLAENIASVIIKKVFNK